MEKWIYKTIVVQAKIRGVSFEIEIKLYHQDTRTIYATTTNKTNNHVGDFRGEHYTYSSLYGFTPTGQEYSFTDPTNFEDYMYLFKCSMQEIYNDVIKKYNKIVQIEVEKYVKALSND